MDQLPAPVPTRDDLLRPLPQWQRVYLNARAAGATEREAVVAARSSETIIQEHYLASRALRDGGKFARAFDAVLYGVYAAGGPETVAAHSLEYANAIVDRFASASLGQLPAPGPGEEIGRA